LHFYDDWLFTVQAVKPGMTGWWQVNGRSSVAWPHRAELDVYYAVHWSFVLDLRILARTPKAVLWNRDTA
ncbi:MAG: sugar transferase, partial [Actinobacteria bacterium]|nr:sugar transferase [Actinomycetota bacterium]